MHRCASNSEYGRAFTSVDIIGICSGTTAIDMTETRTRDTLGCPWTRLRIDVTNDVAGFQRGKLVNAKVVLVFVRRS